MKKIVLPGLGENIEKATVASIYVREGDLIKEEEDLIEVVTDKATFVVPSIVNGVVLEVLVAEGQEISVGEPIVVLKVKEDEKE